MEFDLVKAINLISPAIITLICNIIFYLLIKRSVDKSLEQYKISYSGVFKEKIDIYRELLTKTYDIKVILNNFQYFGTKEKGSEIMKTINQYNRYYRVNKPFISDEIFNAIDQMRKEFQNVFDASYKGSFVTSQDAYKEWVNAGNKLKTNYPFKQIEDKIIAEIKKELKVNN